MTQDEIIRLALEAGIEFEEFPNYSISVICKEHLYDFAAIIAAYTINKTIPVVIAEKEAAVLAEREACAKVCENLYKHLNYDADCQKLWPHTKMINDQYAAAIRARGEKP